MSSRETQTRIKQAAVDLFNQYGTSDIAVYDISRKAGISRGNLQYHFKNKGDIVKAIYADIVAEIDTNWISDEQHPTLFHMAEMFSRQLDLKWRYRFLYREIVTLSRSYPSLGKFIRQTRARRIESTIAFFESLIKANVLKRIRSKKSLRYLVSMTLIFCDNWVNYLELEQDQDTDDIAQLGYDYIIEMLDPFLSAKARNEIYRSYDGITARIKLGRD
jgi:AcrR family transcriptional regulator